MGHNFIRSTFGTNVICERCKLLPLDQDDIESECEDTVTEVGK